MKKWLIFYHICTVCSLHQTQIWLVPLCVSYRAFLINHIACTLRAIHGWRHPLRGEGDLPKGDITSISLLVKWVTRGQKSQKMGDIIYGWPLEVGDKLTIGMTICYSFYQILTFNAWLRNSHTTTFMIDRNVLVEECSGNSRPIQYI